MPSTDVDVSMGTAREIIVACKKNGCLVALTARAGVWMNPPSATPISTAKELSTSFGGGREEALSGAARACPVAPTLAPTDCVLRLPQNPKVVSRSGVDRTLRFNVASPKSPPSGLLATSATYGTKPHSG